MIWEIRMFHENVYKKFHLRIYNTLFLNSLTTSPPTSVGVILWFRTWRKSG